MKRQVTILAPGLVLLLAILTGGWFIHRGVEQDRSEYLQERLLDEVLDHVYRNYVDPVEREDLYDSAIQGILDLLGDPNSSFLAMQDADDFRIQVAGEYGGVGLEVVSRDGWVTVITPLPGSPGTRAGIRAGDQIVEVNGESTEGWDPDDVVDALRGPANSEVSVGIRRPGVEAPIPFTITREVIQLRFVPFALEIRDGIGYVPLQSVNKGSFEEVRQAVDSLRAEGVQKMILDLRGNPGGTLEQAIAITDYFLEPGMVVVETRGRAPTWNETYTASGELRHPGLALLVLVDERSASAAEIIAGALQDHGKAVVVGAPTYGKGSVQTVYPLTGGSMLRLTTARWYTPVGRSINKDREGQIEVIERGVLTLTGSYTTRPESEPKPAFQTAGGRTVFGGGGIVPDVLVVADTLTSSEREALRELDRSGGSFVNTLFNYSVGYLQENPGLTQDFSLSAEDLAEFRNLMAESDVELSPSAFREAERFIRFQLEREIALKAWGEVGEFRRMLPYDRAMQRALQLLESSESTSDLMELSSDGSYSDWTPEPLEAPREPAAADAMVTSPREGEGRGS
jgi:carboxyl-terminal processing protease